jgi:cytochrome d ubiquinol oxidase subunit I
MNAEGQFVVAGSWAAVIFNPSFPYRLVHTVIAAYLTTALVVGGCGAWHLLRSRLTQGAEASGGPATSLPAARKMFSMAMWMAALVAPVQILAGDQQGLNTLEHQPAKVLAMEGDFDPSPNGAPLILFGWPSNLDGKVHYKIEIPKAGSLILKHDPNAPLQGLKDFPRDQWAPVAVVFWSFRVMVGLGFAMLGLGLWSLVARWRHKLYDWSWLHRAAIVMGPAGFVAVIAGWITTEVGRQPWTIYGLLRTSHSASPLAAPAVATSLAAFVIVYFAVFGIGVWYILKLMEKGPQPHEPDMAEAPIRSAGITPAAQIGGKP